MNVQVVDIKLRSYAFLFLWRQLFFDGSPTNSQCNWTYQVDSLCCKRKVTPTELILSFSQTYTGPRLSKRAVDPEIRPYANPFCLQIRSVELMIVTYTAIAKLRRDGGLWLNVLSTKANELLQSSRFYLDHAAFVRNAHSKITCIQAVVKRVPLKNDV